MKILPKAKPGQKVLEVGCGPGKYVALLRTAGFDVVGIDPGFFDSWARLTAKGGVTLMTDVAAEDLPFPDAYFDHVTCLGTLLYLKDPDKGLQEMRRVIKPGGTFVCRTVNSLNFYTMVTGKRLDPASNQLYAMAELKDAVKRAGFTIDGSFSFGFWPPILTDYWWYLICVRIPIWVAGADIRLNAPRPPGEQYRLRARRLNRRSVVYGPLSCPMSHDEAMAARHDLEAGKTGIFEG